MFTVVIKPTHICNLSCSYCFNDDVRNPIMDFNTLGRVITETFAYARTTKQPSVTFIWHGGEPTVAGVDFFQEAVRLQKSVAQDLQYENLFQTNGVLINEKWIDFFRENNFQISISIDGNEIHNDKYRVDFAGKGTFKKVMRAMDLLTSHGVSFGACLTLHKGNVKDAKLIYEFLSQKGLGFHIVPLMKSGGARDDYDQIGLTENEYGDAWIEMYDCWFDSNPQYAYVTDFVSRTEAVLRGEPTSCWTSSNCCDENFTVDPEGNVYSCASLSATSMAFYGNLNTDSLEKAFETKNALFWRTRQHSEQCKSCKWFHVCHGGCMARSYKFFNDIDVADYYCDSLFRIYEHIEKRLAESGTPIAKPSPNHMRSQLPADTRAKIGMPNIKSKISIIPIKVVQ